MTATKQPTKKASHTPGPLFVRGTYSEVSVCKEGVGAIARLGGKVRAIDTAEDAAQMLADANLFAAAPELLAALKALLSTAVDLRFIASEGARTDDLPAMAAARAAITKAKGL